MNAAAPVGRRVHLTPVERTALLTVVAPEGHPGVADLFADVGRKDEPGGPDRDARIVADDPVASWLMLAAFARGRRALEELTARLGEPGNGVPPEVRQAVLAVRGAALRMLDGVDAGVVMPPLVKTLRGLGAQLNGPSVIAKSLTGRQVHGLADYEARGWDRYGHRRSAQRMLSDDETRQSGYLQKGYRAPDSRAG